VPINPSPPNGQDARDTELLEQLAQARACGDANAERTVTGELLAGWLARVEGLARFRGIEAHAIGDVVGRWGERMIRALSKRTSFDGPFGAVVMLNAGWACTDEQRAARDRDQLAGDPLELVANDGVPGAEETTDVLVALDAAIAGLSERERTILDAFFTERSTHREIAAKLKISEGAAKTALSRALGKLRRRLHEAGVTNRGSPPV
jgi:RNA polymerase sigma factor (sigma-70 family)